jgi:hypothetical protein
MSQLERFTHGETDAFEHLFRQFQGQVFAWIVRIVRDRGLAERSNDRNVLAYLSGTGPVPPGREASARGLSNCDQLGAQSSPAQAPEEELPENLAQANSPDTAVQQEASDCAVFWHRSLLSGLEICGRVLESGGRD